MSIPPSLLSLNGNSEVVRDHEMRRAMKANVVDKMAVTPRLRLDLWGPLEHYPFRRKSTDHDTSYNCLRNQEIVASLCIATPRRIGNAQTETTTTEGEVEVRRAGRGRGRRAARRLLSEARVLGEHLE